MGFYNLFFFMTAAVTKIQAGINITTPDTLKSLLVINKDSIKAENTTFFGTTTWLDSVTVSLVGQADTSKEPYKTMNGWYATNQAAITSANLTN